MNALINGIIVFIGVYIALKYLNADFWVVIIILIVATLSYGNGLLKK